MVQYSRTLVSSLIRFLFYKSNIKYDQLSGGIDSRNYDMQFTLHVQLVSGQIDGQFPGRNCYAIFFGVHP
jgi:hypothetical protein